MCRWAPTLDSGKSLKRGALRDLMLLLLCQRISPCDRPLPLKLGNFTEQWVLVGPYMGILCYRNLPPRSLKSHISRPSGPLYEGLLDPIMRP